MNVMHANVSPDDDDDGRRVEEQLGKQSASPIVDQKKEGTSCSIIIDAPAFEQSLPFNLSCPALLPCTHINFLFVVATLYCSLSLFLTHISVVCVAA